MAATDREELVEDADLLIAPPIGTINELLDVGNEDNMQGQVRVKKKLLTTDFVKFCPNMFS